MSKIKHSLVAKVAAIFLFVLSVFGTLGGVLSITFLVDNNFYETSFDEVKLKMFENITKGNANRVFNTYLHTSSYDLDYYDYVYDLEKTNFLFILKDTNGKIILSNYDEQDFQLIRKYDYYDIEYFTDEDGRTQKTEVKYTMDCFVKKTLSTKDRYFYIDRYLGFAYNMRYAVIIILIISLISAILLFIFLMCSAGHKKNIDGVVANGIDKIPFDIFLVIILAVFYLGLEILFSMYNISSPAMVICMFTFAIIGVLLILLTCMSFATRYKLGSLWKNTITHRLFRFIGRLLRKLLKGIKYLYQHLSLIKKTIIVLICLVLIEFLGLAVSFDRGGLLLLFWIIEKIILIPIIMLVVVNLGKLQQGGEKIAFGDLNYQIDTKNMFWDFRLHGENLNSIGDGMSKAVDERMKSERFKTELITNVSHDIKTPLTSIITYVDLIKKEDIENQTLSEYVDVLDRQSSRLKKLVEDLVEASKASTGNITVNMERTEIGVLFTQAIGEYEERLNNNGLEIILDKPEESIFVLGDGRLLWRVFDNLLCNVCKYAQPQTRVYINLEMIDEQAVITIKNISKYALNISSDELIERFVRGDRSRNTEGSGLGLSISKSLVELQNGKFDLYIDGDLFKVILSFSIID
jgi:signal transduction histidine kinase